MDSSSEQLTLSELGFRLIVVGFMLLGASWLHARYGAPCLRGWSKYVEGVPEYEIDAALEESKRRKPKDIYEAQRWRQWWGYRIRGVRIELIVLVSLAFATGIGFIIAGLFVGS